jgi:predicted oxidoreductase (fatty acid repression mutant protein)
MKKEDIKRDRYMFDPFDNKKLELLSQYEEFKNIPMMKKGGNLYTYLSLAYDINSDVIKEFPIRAQQRFEAAKLAGFKIVNNEFDKNIEEVFLGTNYDFNRAVSKFVSLFGSPEWMIWNIHNKNLENELYNAMKGDTKKQSTENAIKIGEELQNIQKKLFFGDDTQSLRKAFYDFNEKAQNIMPKPENMAEMIEKYPDPMDFQEALGSKPYGDYNPTTQKDYLHFKGSKV